MKKLVIVILTVLLLVASVVGCQQQPEPVTPSKGPTTLAILVESNTVEVGSSFMVSGSNFKPKEWVFAKFEYRFSNGRGECVAYLEADEQGSIHLRMKVLEDVVPGDYEVKIYTGSSLNIKDRRLLTTLPIYVEARGATKVGQVLDIRVEPSPGTSLTKGIILDQAIVKIGSLDRSGFILQNREHYYVGDRCLLVLGDMRNDTDEDLYVDLWAEGFDSGERQVAWSISSGTMVGHVQLDMPQQSINSFEILLNWAEDVQLIKIIAHSYDRMIPSPPESK